MKLTRSWPRWQQCSKPANCRLTLTEADLSDVADRVTTRSWELDLSFAGKVYAPKKRPAKLRRQKIARFIERDGTVEHFAIRQTIPYCGYEAFCPPSQAQYGAASDFFGEVCETRFQANTLLSARDYAEVVAKNLPFTAPRRRFIWICATAFILSDKDLRSRVRSWNIACRSRGSSGIESGIASHEPYKLVARFASKLIDDMRGEGAEIFG